MTKYFFIFAFILILPLAAHAQVSIQTKAKQAIVVDYDTGAVLFAKNAQERMPTSSMSKVISMYAVFDTLKSGQISLDDTFIVSEKAWRKGGSKMFVEVNKRVKVEDLIRGVIVQSGNDATIVLAEGLKGNEAEFADVLNEHAKALGMASSNFMNASGWPDPDHYSTAEDLSILAKSIIRDFPEYYKYYSEREFTYNNITQANRNPLIYKNIGADGIKTGHTEAGGYGLMGSGTQSGRRVIIVVNGLDSTQARAEESGALLEWGLQRFKNHTLLSAGDVVDQAPVALGRENTVDLNVGKEIVVTLPKGGEKAIEVTVKYKGPLITPIAQGQEVGTLEIKLPYDQVITVPLYAAQAVEAQGFFSAAITRAKYLIAGYGA